MATLGELADSSGGAVRTGPFGSQLHSSDYVAGLDGVPVVMPKDMSGGYVDYSTIARIGQRKAAELRQHVTAPGDILLARRGEIGRCALVKEKDAGTLCGTGCIRISIQGSAVIPTFLHRFLLAPATASRLEGMAVGATMANLNAGIVRSLPVPVPPMDEQVHIVTVLSAYDDLIENNGRRIQILEEMAQAIYREWFVELRFPRHEDVQMVDSELGPIPEGWTVQALGHLCLRVTDGAHMSPPSVLDGYPMASVKDMTPRSINLDGCRRIAPAHYEELVRQDCKPREGDVLIAKDGSYLKHVFVVERECDLAILSSIALLRPGAALDPWILALHLRQPETKDRLASYVSGAAIPRIVLRDFMSFPVVLPPPQLQEAFVKKARPMLVLALRLEEANAVLRRARDLLLPRLISGEIDVSNLDIGSAEPAA
jgi:type I restriction enzyme S subunit